MKITGAPVRLVSSIVLVVAIAATTVAGTLAYFSNTRDESTTLTTAKIAVGGTAGFGMTFANMLPGETISKTVQVQNGGNRAADLYIQLKDHDTAQPNFCVPNDTGVVLEIPGIWTGDICKAYPGWSGSVMIKVADDVAPGAVSESEIKVTLPTNLPNIFQEKTVNNTVRIIAVQFDAPAPVAATTGGDANLFTSY